MALESLNGTRIIRIRPALDWEVWKPILALVREGWEASIHPHAINDSALIRHLLLLLLYCVTHTLGNPLQILRIIMEGRKNV